jgi:hypothetical protein
VSIGVKKPLFYQVLGVIMSRQSKAKKRQKKYNPLKRFQKASGRGMSSASNFLNSHKKPFVDIEKIAEEQAKERNILYKPFESAIFENSKVKDVACRLAGIIEDTFYGYWFPERQAKLEADIQELGEELMFRGESKSMSQIVLLCPSYLQEEIKTIWNTVKETYEYERNLGKELELIAMENYEKYKKDQLEKVFSKSKEELLLCEDWIFITEIEESCYGKLDTFLNSFDLTHRREECLVNGFIDFDEILDEEGGCIACKTIEYDPDSDKTMIGRF